MDTGKGEFTQLSKKIAERFLTDKGLDMTSSRVFTEGEIVRVKGSRFKVERIKRRTLRLLLLPDEENIR